MYIPLCGEFQDVSIASIIQFYHEAHINTPYDIQTPHYYSKVGMYTPAQTIIKEIADGYLFKEQIHAAYNALRIGLKYVLEEDIYNIVLHTDAVQIMDNIIMDYLDGEHVSTTTNMCNEARELHDEVVELLDEFDTVGFRCLDIGMIKAFEGHVHSSIELMGAMQSLSVTAAPADMDLD